MEDIYLCFGFTAIFGARQGGTVLVRYWFSQGKSSGILYLGSVTERFGVVDVEKGVSLVVVVSSKMGPVGTRLFGRVER